MASSDDEGERSPNEVSDYHFEDSNKEPVSFAELTLKWDDAKSSDGNKKEISLHGSIDNMLQKIFRLVTAWKFDYSYPKPEILVLTQKNEWIKLLKPRKSFENTIRTILITVNCLNVVKRNPEISGKALWETLAKVFSSYEPRPTELDLGNHFNLISEAVSRDEELKRSKVLAAFLEGKPMGKKALSKEPGTTSMSNFIVDDENVEAVEDGSDDEEADCFDYVCAICDNGGEILCCEGKCLRSFHATQKAGEESACESLGYSEEQVKAMTNQTFMCKNCQYKQHQCYVCGELGSSDKSARAEVFQCVTGTCGYFYHPNCVAKALHFKYGDKSKELEGDIAAGKPFMCPIHFCAVCHELEPGDKNDAELHFAVCRRCPNAYHKKCLPKMIAMEDDEDQGIVQRAWEGLIPNKILIYCVKHEIEDDLATPARNHIKFPNTDLKKNKQTSDLVSEKKVVTKNRLLVAESIAGDSTATKQSKALEKPPSVVKNISSTKENEGRLSVKELARKRKLTDISNPASNKAFSGKDNKSIDGASRASLGEMLHDYFKDSEKVKIVKGEKEKAAKEKPKRKVGPVAKEVDNSVKLDADSEKRILDIVREAESSITLEDIMKKHGAPLTHGSSLKNILQSLTLGKIEGSVEALRAALQKLEEGGNLEDAKAVCEPGLLSQIPKWKEKLRVHLAPFLYGPRYTSFGRHFTKVEKLQAIVDKLHCYVQDGDMVVDFCCGSNDFSRLMKEKMDEMGKSWKFKNYDIFAPQNTFNFELKDWMTVRRNELPEGSKLIMGLNPPFGTNAILARKFIEKALKFEPKLLILIVPRETGGVDEKSRYNLIWEDVNLLSGKAFYLPGSVDINDKPLEDWNVSPPPLYLWSRQDWTVKHKEIAQQHGHLPGCQNVDACHLELDMADCSRELPSSGSLDSKQLQEQGKKVSETESQNDHGRKNQSAGDGHEGNKKRKRKRVPDKKPTGRQSLPHHSSSPMAVERSLDSAKHGKKFNRAQAQRSGHQNVSGSHMLRERGYGNHHDNEMATRNSLNSNEHYMGAGNRWQHPVDPGSGYGRRASPAEQFVGYPRDPEGIPAPRAPYFAERINAYGMEGDMRVPPAQLYGHQGPAFATHPGNHHLAGLPSPVFPPTYRQLGATVVNTGYNNVSTSAMQKYAPRLDELNALPRMNNIMGRMQHLGVRSDTHHITAPPPPRPGPRHGGGSFDFARGPFPSFSQSSAGWLNE